MGIVSRVTKSNDHPSSLLGNLLAGSLKVGKTHET